MPPKPKFTREKITEAALNIIRTRGAESLTARELGKALGSSPCPIFTLFADMDGLDDREKWLLYLRYVSGYTYVEIARMLALPYEQVKKQGYRAYLKLKRAWEG